METENQLQIRLITKQDLYAVPDVPLSVPQNVDGSSLNDLVNQLIKENNATLQSIQFDFLVLGELLRVPLIDHITERNVSTETIIDVEYIERTPAPEPENSLLHDDWVSSVQTRNKWILTGCYDNSVNIWTVQGKLITSNKQHKNIIKAVTWIDQHDPAKGFVSVSSDLTGIMWSFDQTTGDIESKAILRGHTRGVDCVGASLDGKRLATGSWDTYLKIWSTSLEDDGTGEPASKKYRGPGNVISKVPLHTLNGHKEVISSAVWMTNQEVCTTSMDHTIKFWDIELCGLKNEIVGQKSFFSCSWSPLSNTLLTSSADKHIRLYDPRSADGSLCKTTFTSHTLWVSSVTWSKHDQYLFMSGGYDADVKLWDTRCPKGPLYNLQGHEGQVLSVDWTNQKYLVSGGTDNNVHVFKNKC